MNFNNSRLVDHKPMKFGSFVPYMYRFVILVKYLTNFFKLEWNLGIKFTLRFFFLSVYKIPKLDKETGAIPAPVNYNIPHGGSIYFYSWILKFNFKVHSLYISKN